MLTDWLIDLLILIVRKSKINFTNIICLSLFRESKTLNSYNSHRDFILERQPIANKRSTPLTLCYLSYRVTGFWLSRRYAWPAAWFSKLCHTVVFGVSLAHFASSERHNHHIPRSEQGELSNKDISHKPYMLYIRTKLRLPG